MISSNQNLRLNRYYNNESKRKTLTLYFNKKKGKKVMTINYAFNVRFSKKDIEDFVNREIKEPNDTCMKIAYFENFGNNDTYDFDIFTISNWHIISRELVSIVDWIKNKYFSDIDVKIWADQLPDRYGTEKFEIHIENLYEEDFKYVTKFSNDLYKDPVDNEPKDINGLNDCVDMGAY